MRKKKETSYEGFEVKVPSGSDLPGRMKKISELTGLPDYELLQKWLAQEESALNISRYYAETIQSRLKQDVAEQLRVLLGELQKTGKPEKPEAAKAAKTTKNEKKTEGPEEYRQTILQRARAMKDEGISFVKIAAQFNNEGVATVSGTGKWYPSSVFQLLK